MVRIGHGTTGRGLVFHSCLDSLKRDNKGAKGCSELCGGVRSSLGEGHAAAALSKTLTQHECFTEQSEAVTRW